MTFRVTRYAAIAAPAQGERPASPPPLLRRFGTAAIALGKWASEGARLASDDVLAERQAKCEMCPERVGRWCRFCSCWLPLKFRLATSICPANPPRW